jgi:hypothetical protein
VREVYMNIDSEKLTSILLGLVAEAYDGPADPGATWFADNQAASGLLGTLERLDAAEASCPLGPTDEASAAAHAGHILFSLNLANRALRGENVHESAVWSDSWKHVKVDEGGWESLLVELRAEYESLCAAIQSGLPWKDEMALTGIFGQLAHGAWHLGAIRQGLGLVRLPAGK